MTTELDAVSRRDDVLDPRRWLALTVISATLMVVLDASVINIALPQWSGRACSD